MRATFKLWYEEDGMHYAMFEKDDTRLPHEVVQYPMGSERLCSLMAPVLAAINSSDELRLKADYCSFLTTRATDDALVTITYNKPLSEDTWSAAASRLVGELGPSVKLVGRSKGVKLVVGGDSLSETLHVPHGRGVCQYDQTEGAFTQPNAAVCEQMLGWAYEATAGSEGSDLCELYCGSACFTVALAPRFRSVVATEVSKASVALAKKNLERNNLCNVKVARLSADEFSQAMRGERPFARLDDAGVALPGAYSFETLLVDPPRSGLDQVCIDLASGFRRVVYISCNPETLARDVGALHGTHTLVRLAAFDQFPYTEHLECGVVLERRRVT